MTFDISGINAEIGLELYDDDEDMYIAVLRSCATNLPATLDKLRDVSAETLPAYGIAVHGLKGITANIGAMEVSNKAKALEALAKDDDLPGLQAQNEALLKDVQALINNISTWLEANVPYRE